MLLSRHLVFPTSSRREVGFSSPTGHWRCPCCNGHRHRKWTRVQILEDDCISHSTNTLGKGMKPIIIPPAIGK